MSVEATGRFLGLLLLFVAAAGASEVDCGLSAPPPGPLIIEGGVILVDVFQLSDVEQQFTVDLVGVTRWEDPRLADCPNASHDDLWQPSLSMTNRRVRAALGPARLHVAGSQVTRSQRFTGQLSAPLDLRDFPFDRQLLVAEAVLVDAPAGIELRPIVGLTGQRDELTLAGWTLGEGRLVTSTWDVLAGTPLPSVRYELPAERNTGYFGWKVILPMVVILFMAWGVYWVPAGNFPTQMSVATTSVLTLFAYQFALSNVLPRVAYLTRMDQFSLGAVVLVLLSFSGSLLLGRLVHVGREDLARRLGRGFRWLFPLAILAVIAFAFIA